MFKRRPPSTRPTGFTLLELLVVISIIVVLVGLLLPVVSKVRARAHVVDTQAQITQLSASIQAYYGDFNAYPGPVPNAQLRNPGPPTNPMNPGCNIVGVLNAPSGAPAWNVANMSMAENLYLGLMGGLVQSTPAVTPPTFEYDYNLNGTGARALRGTPKKFPVYTDKVDVSDGVFEDSNGTTANDTVIPEFIDRFPDAMPLLYLRARPQAVGVATTSNNPPPAESVQQYDVQQVISYTGSNIGVGRSVSASAYVGGTMHPEHGLKTANPNACIGPPPTTPAGLQEVYPYDLYAALVSTNVQRVQATPTMPANTPRQKDSYILISAGIDRVYGTADDITNFNGY